MLCVETMSSMPHTYQNVVNIDLRDWLPGVLPPSSQCEVTGWCTTANHHSHRTNGHCQQSTRRSVPAISFSAQDELSSSQGRPKTILLQHVSSQGSAQQEQSQGKTVLSKQLSQLNFKNAHEVRYFERLLRNHKLLLESGFYYDGLDMKSAKKRLKNGSVGTFLLRSSSDSRFLFAISVATHRGPTSVRIVYSKGRFRLDCEADFEDKMPRFTNVIELIQHYVKNSEIGTREHSQCFWLESSGRRDEPVTLSQPQKHSVSSLKHLSRRAIHKHCDGTDSNDLINKAPLALQDYLKEYPYWL